MGERVVIVDYDPAWPRLFEEEKSRLTGFLDIQHVGSTAVPGCAAKPIIDLLALAPALPPDAAALSGLGYQALGEHGIPARHFFRKDGRHLHVVSERGAFWAAHLRFRDHLRRHPEDVAAYVRLKRDLAARFQTDREGYGKAKASFIAEILSRAG